MPPRRFMTQAADNADLNDSDYGDMCAGIVALLEAARSAASRSVNALMTAAYWEVGHRIVDFEQGGERRAVYGEVLIKRLGVDLGHRFGRALARATWLK